MSCCGDRSVELHPLVVLFATTAGSLLFGSIGGVFAAPCLKIGLDAVSRLKAAGIFSDPASDLPPEAAETLAAPELSP